MRGKILIISVLSLFMHPLSAGDYSTPAGGRVGHGIDQPKTRIVVRAGEIKDSLFLAGHEAGLSDRVIMQLFKIFGRRGDNHLDVQPGDQFAVVYEQRLEGAGTAKDSHVLAAHLTTHGNERRAVRYTNRAGRADYFTGFDRAVGRHFLRAPLNYTRISSPFDLRRRHPILNRIRAHRGVDFAAPRGTPVMASGNGLVVFVGTKKGHGNTITVRHDRKHTTLYAHLSRFHPGTTPGRRVRQGQVIGYVGQSGLATGPHLHYEFHVDGVPRDPLALNMAAALPQTKMPNFRARSMPLLAALDTALTSRSQDRYRAGRSYRPTSFLVASD